MAQEDFKPTQDQIGQPEEPRPNMMGFFDHMDELRARLMRVLIGFLAVFIACYLWVVEFVLKFLRKPLFAVLPPDQHKLYFTSLFENFLTHIKVSAYCSIALLSPYLFYEIWAFIAPGLYPREKKWVTPFVAIATVFFIGGAGFAYTVLFPVAFKFFVTYGVSTDAPMLTIDSYYGTCLKLMLLFGAAFEFPVLICLLGFVGAVDAEMLRAHRKTAILGITLGSALFAPPDAVSMLILMAPLILMYEGSIWVVRWIRVKRAQEMRDPPEVKGES